jgi:RNA polymerase sigma-70 factor (ECF subfamily)
MQPTEELLQRCCKDDRRAHLELYRMSFSFIFSVCRRYHHNKDDVEAALNAVFFKVIVGMRSYLKKDKKVPFDLWVRRIALNHITDEYRKNKKYRDLLDQSVSADQFAETVFDNSDFSVADEDTVLRAIDKLPAMGKAVFNLHIVEGYKHEEIAALLDISPNTSKVHLHRAKKQLQEILRPTPKKNLIVSNDETNG